MTAQETLNRIESQREEAGIAFLGNIYLEVPDYFNVVNALEKQIPKKVRTEGYRYWGEAKFGYCDCGCGVNSTDNLYCNKCGQALDWSDTE